MTYIDDEIDSRLGDANLNFVNNTNSMTQDPMMQKYNTIQHVDKGALKTEEPICRICLTEDEPDNPIISACKCIGSVKFIHLQCI